MHTETQGGLFGMMAKPFQGTESLPVAADVAAIDRKADFEALYELLAENERLFEQLATTIHRLRKTREWLLAPDCDPELGNCLLRSLRKRRERLAEALRANRSRANGLLGQMVLGDQA
jgi:hypothetical protein